jgi:uncharacterized protein YndB with AHSA1/START domain
MKDAIMDQGQAETRTVTVERELPFPPERVWRALTVPELLAEWLMPGDVAAVPGHAFRLQGEWGGVDCEVLNAEPHRRLSLRWDHPHGEPAFDLRSVVTFTLEPTARGTRMTVEQRGFRPDQKLAYGGARAGWPQHLESLARALARAG